MLAAWPNSSSSGTESSKREGNRPRWGGRTSTPDEVALAVSCGFDSHSFPPRRGLIGNRVSARPPSVGADDRVCGGGNRGFD